MSKRYRSVRMPIEAYENWIIKKKQMENDFSNMLNGTRINIPLTNILTEASKKPIFDEIDIQRLIGRKKLR